MRNNIDTFSLFDLDGNFCGEVPALKFDATWIIVVQDGDKVRKFVAKCGGKSGIVFGFYEISSPTAIVHLDSMPKAP